MPLFSPLLQPAIDSLTQHIKFPSPSCIDFCRRCFPLSTQQWPAPTTLTSPSHSFTLHSPVPFVPLLPNGKQLSSDCCSFHGIFPDVLTYYFSSMLMPNSAKVRIFTIAISLTPQYILLSSFCTHHAPRYTQTCNTSISTLSPGMSLGARWLPSLDAGYQILLLRL